MAMQFAIKQNRIDEVHHLIVFAKTKGNFDMVLTERDLKNCIDIKNLEMLNMILVDQIMIETVKTHDVLSDQYDQSSNNSERSDGDNPETTHL